MSGPSSVRRIGVISDTHGLLRPEAVAALEGCELILHAGDVGRAEILYELERVAPVRAVRGNVDRGGWADGLPLTQHIEVGGSAIWMLHDRAELDLVAREAGIDVIVFGHSHRALIERVDDVLYFNPGAAGPRRFRFPATVGELVILEGRIEPRIIELDPR